MALYANPSDVAIIKNEKKAREKYRIAKKHLCAMLQQKSKFTWLKCGDENTKVFYQAVRARRSRNKVHAIHNCAGEWLNSQEKVNEAFHDFYKALFTEMKWIQPVFDLLLSKGQKLSKEHMRMLNCPFNKDDVRRVIFSIQDDKAPGADGMNIYFLNIVGGL